MADSSTYKAQELFSGDADLHAVILRTCVQTPKNKKAYTVSTENTAKTFVVK